MAEFALRLLCVLGLGLAAANCSILFEDAKSGSTPGAIDAGIPGPDAKPTDSNKCGVPLPGTIGYFPVDGEQGSLQVLDTVSGVIADSVAVEDGVLTPRPLNSSSRVEENCGDAARLDGIEGQFVRIGSQRFKNALSLDFWFQTAILSDGPLGGLLTADGQGNDSGDMGIFIFKSDVAGGDPDASTPTHHVLLRLQDGAGGIYYGCSDPIALGAWNHVAVSFDGLEGGAQLFVNGVLAENTRAIVPSDSVLGSHPCGSGLAANSVTLTSNARPWLWGASNIGGPDVPARDGTRGDIDELRFRTQKFSLQEAQLVYESLSR